MDTHATTDVKPKLLEALARAQAQLQTFADGLSDDERAAIGEATHWSAKDNIAHMAFWIRKTSAVFAAVRQGIEPPPSEDIFQPINERVFAEWQARPWAETLAAAQAAYTQLIADVERSSEEELTDTERFPSRKGDPLSSSVIGSAVGHPAEHYAQYYLEHGDPARATAVQTQAVGAIRDTFGPSEALGDAYYNLACFYATHGQPDAAIDLVRQSFPLHQSLVAWSRQDADLDPLRDLPAFQALYAD
ncbi:MAG TPA: DinB family protein [Ktedonobacterales bacterium]|nr:DinB family protein [Ktedonobacterales bacterium]